MKSLKLFKITLLSLFTLLSFSTATAYVEAQTIDFKDIDTSIENIMKDLNIPGLAIGIVKDKQVIYLNSYGKADENGQKITPQTPFIIGSTTKSFTALAILKLVDEGKIRLSDPVIKYLPYFHTKNDQESSKITIQDLLHQTSGFSTETGSILFENIDQEHPLEDYVKRLATVELTHSVGTVHEYSNTNYILLGRVIEEVSGLTYGEYIQKNLFNPLNMSHSYTSLAEGQTHNLAQGYFNDNGLSTPYTAGFPYFDSALPAGFIISTAEDMTHYLSYQMNGYYSDQLILSPEEFSLLHEKGVPISSTSTATYGMGLMSMPLNNQTLIWHNGDIGFYHAEIVFIPEKKVGFILLMNRGDLIKSLPFNQFLGELIKKIDLI